MAERLANVETMVEFVRKYTPCINGETTMECVERSIRNAPTIEAKPVVHAHWTGSNGTHCSHCERSYMDVADADSWESSDIPDFCPYCGATMDSSEAKDE